MKKVGVFTKVTFNRNKGLNYHVVIAEWENDFSIAGKLVTRLA